MAPASSPVNGDKKLKFKYDYMNRRIEKRVYVYNNGWPADSSPNELLRFVYDQWNVVLVLDGNDSNAIDRKYTWGLDLSGQRAAGFSPRGLSDGVTAAGVHGAGPATAQLHGAGGIGGLLAVEESLGPIYWFFYDANGNVTQAVLTLSLSIAAHYEYDPFGNAIVASGTYAAANPFRFSTKWFDAESGLGYYGYRYLGERWFNRDPIEENGGANLYAFVGNSPTSSVDPIGLLVGAPPAPAPPVVALPVASFCIGYGIGTAICHCTKIDEGLGWVIWKCNPWAPKPTPWTPPKRNKADCGLSAQKKCENMRDWCLKFGMDDCWIGYRNCVHNGGKWDLERFPIPVPPATPDRSPYE